MSASADALLLRAVQLGDPEMLRAAVARGAAVDLRDAHGTTALMHACMLGGSRAGDSGAITRSLLELKASPDGSSAAGTTALHCAVSTGHTAAVDALLASGAPVNAADAGGVRALMTASLAGHTELARRLLRAKADPSAADLDGGTALMRACARGHQSAVQALLEARADTEFKALDDGATALHSAAAEGNEVVVALLLQAGARADARDAAGRTPLQLAEDNSACARLLLVAEAATARPRGQAGDGGSSPAWLLLGSDSGVLKTTLRPGDALRGCPPRGSVVTVRYRGWLLPRGGAGGAGDRHDRHPTESSAKAGGEPRAKAGEEPSGPPVDESPVPHVEVRLMGGGEFDAVGVPAFAPRELDVATASGDGTDQAGHDPPPPPNAAPPPPPNDAQPTGPLTAPPLVTEPGLRTMAAGLHLAVGSMAPGELARVLLRPPHHRPPLPVSPTGTRPAPAQGGDGPDIPPGASVQYLIELLAWRASGGVQARSAPEVRQKDRGLSAGPCSDPSKSDAIAAATSLKEQGNAAFRRSDWRPALEAYNRAASVASEACAGPGAVAVEAVGKARAPTPTEVATLLTACLLNAAQCHLKLGQPAEAEAYCTRALEANPASAKTLYRRATARRRMALPVLALEDATAALRLEPRSADARALHAECRGEAEAARRAERAQAQRMMAGAFRPVKSGDGSAGSRASGGTGSDRGSGAACAALAAGVSPAEAALTFANEERLTLAKADAREGNLVQDVTTGRVQCLSDEQLGGQADGYSWAQNEREVSIRIPGLPRGTQGADVRVHTTSDSISVRYRGVPLVEGRLHRRILSDETIFTLDEELAVAGLRGARGAEARVSDAVAAQAGRLSCSAPCRPAASAEASAQLCCVLTVTLTKLEPTRADRHWRCAVDGQAEIEPSVFGAAVLGFHENNPADVAEYINLQQLLASKDAARKLREANSWLDFGVAK
eukprot:scaffold20566_cov135-Isochrysis_galbana.AAC.9